GSVHGGVVLDDAVGERDQAVVRGDEVEDRDSGAVALGRAAIGEGDIGQGKVGVAAGAGVELHAAAVAIVAVGAVVVAKLKREIGDAGRRIGDGTNVLIDRHHHIHAVGVIRSCLNDGRVLAGAHNVYRVVYVQSAVIPSEVSPNLGQGKR